MLASVFTNHIVFAEQKPIRVFGTGDGPVTVHFLGKTQTTCAVAGKWRVDLPAMPAGGPYTLTVEEREQTTVLSDVYIGKVFLLAGQSNAELPLSQTNTPASCYADDALLREYFVARPWNEREAFLPGAGWHGAVREEAKDWSALSYLIGRFIRGKTHGAVGMISCFQGASVIESWLPEKEAERFLLPREQLFYDHFCPSYAAWNQPAAIYKTMLSPLFPLSFNAVIWYQGESDTSAAEAKQYDAMLCRFMECVREADDDPWLLFAVIQIADCEARIKQFPEGWRGIQQAQERAAACDAHSFLVRSADICETDNIHPPTKTRLAERTAEALLANAR